MSELRANTISDAAGTGPATLTGQYAAKAWVNFNGTGTVAIRDSENVSSLTDNGTGDYTLNWSSAFSDTNYCAVTGVGAISTPSEFASQACPNGPYLTTSLRVAGGFVVPTAQGQTDRSLYNVSINGDLA